MPLLPPHACGQRIGLFGGSFDPPHAGHLHVSRVALKRLRLDRIWWLVTPGNPLKETAGLTPMAARLAAARALAADPRIVVTDVEARLRTRYTCDTLAAIRARAPGVHFVWIMGADNLLQFHRWRRWEAIARTMPIAVVDRPGGGFRTIGAKALQCFAGARLREPNAARLPSTPPPAIVVLHGPRSALSSTALRNGHLSPS